MFRQNPIRQKLGTISIDLLAQNLTKPNLKVHNRTDVTLYGLTQLTISNVFTLIIVHTSGTNHRFS